MKLRDLFSLITDEFALMQKDCLAIRDRDAYEEDYKRSEYKRKRFELLKEFMLSIGGKLIGSGCYSYAYEFSLPWGDVVVKISRSNCNFVSRQELDANPALREHYLRPLFQHRNCLIQPRCEVLRGGKNDLPYDEMQDVSDTLECKLRDASPSGWHYDCHPGNLGYWRGKLVIFDAMPCND